LVSKEKGAAIKMTDFGLAVQLPKDEEQGWFGELQSYVSDFAGRLALPCVPKDVRWVFFIT